MSLERERGGRELRERDRREIYLFSTGNLFQQIYVLRSKFFHFDNKLTTASFLAYYRWL